MTRARRGAPRLDAGTTLEEMVAEMVAHDLAEAKRSTACCATSGFAVTTEPMNSPPRSPVRSYKSGGHMSHARVCCRSPRHGGFSAVPAARGPRRGNGHPHPHELDLTDQAAVDAFLRQRGYRPGVPGGGEGRRHPGQQHLPGGFYLRQPADRGEPHPCAAPPRRPAAAVPRLLLHLPEARRAAHAEEALLTGRWSPPTSPTPSPRSPASSSARATTASTARTSARSCRPTSTAPATTSTPRTAT